MAKVILTANRKGGVGKTTVVVTLAHCLVNEKNKNVCVIDTDPQGSATYALCGDMINDEIDTINLAKTLESREIRKRNPDYNKFIRQQVNFLITDNDTKLSLVPCSDDLWDIEDKIFRNRYFVDNPLKHYSNKIKKLIKILDKHYDYIIIDTPPGRTMFSSVLIKLADLVVIPCKPEPLSFKGIQKIEKEISLNNALLKARWLWTMPEGRKWREAVEDFKNNRSHIQSIAAERGVDQTVEGTSDVNQDFHLPRRIKIANAMKSWQPRTFSGHYGGDESALINQMTDQILDELQGADS